MDFECPKVELLHLIGSNDSLDCGREVSEETLVSARPAELEIVEAELSGRAEDLRTEGA